MALRLASVGYDTAWENDCRGSSTSRFTAWLEREGYSAVTILQYGKAIAHAENWLGLAERPPLRLCQWPDIQAYFTSRPDTHATRALTRNALHAYWRYLGRKFPGKLRVPTRPEMVSKALDTCQLERVFEAARMMGTDVFAACALGYYAAFRRAEICRAKWEDFGEDWLRVIGKGNKEARLPVHPKLREALEGVPRVSRFVLPSPRDPSKPIADGTLNMWFQALRLATGVAVSPHVLRHTAITEVNDRTGKLYSAQRFARHADPRVTAGYTKLRTQRLIEAVNVL